MKFNLFKKLNKTIKNIFNKKPKHNDSDITLYEDDNWNIINQSKNNINDNWSTWSTNDQESSFKNPLPSIEQEGQFKIHLINLIKLISNGLGIVHNINPNGIYYSQKYINTSFKNGQYLKETIDDLKYKNCLPLSIEPIKVCIIDNKIHTFDNRRLYCFLEAGINNISVVYILPNRNIFNKLNQSYREEEGDFLDVVVSPYAKGDW